MSPAFWCSIGLGLIVCAAIVWMWLLSRAKP